MKTIVLFSVGLLLSFSKSDRVSELNVIVDAWHLAASRADFNEYFDAMAPEFVFLGTAPGERWRKEEFATFSKPYFDKGKAWDFKPSNRNWSFSQKGDIAWFDEDLETWMGGCRGSGIIKKKKGKWQFVYYNLTVLIENEAIDSFIKLRSTYQQN